MWKPDKLDYTRSLYILEIGVDIKVSKYVPDFHLVVTKDLDGHIDFIIVHLWHYLVAYVQFQFGEICFKRPNGEWLRDIHEKDSMYHSLYKDREKITEAISEWNSGRISSANKNLIVGYNQHRNRENYERAFELFGVQKDGTVLNFASSEPKVEKVWSRLADDWESALGVKKDAVIKTYYHGDRVVAKLINRTEEDVGVEYKYRRWRLSLVTNGSSYYLYCREEKGATFPHKFYVAARFADEVDEQLLEDVSILVAKKYRYAAEVYDKWRRVGERWDCSTCACGDWRCPKFKPKRETEYRPEFDIAELGTLLYKVNEYDVVKGLG